MKRFLVLKDNGFGDLEWHVETWIGNRLIDSYPVETCETQDYLRVSK